MEAEDGIIHELFAGDITHPKSKEIKEALEDLLQTSFGLCSTTVGIPIRIVKKLIIDCALVHFSQLVNYLFFYTGVTEATSPLKEHHSVSDARLLSQRQLAKPLTSIDKKSSLPVLTLFQDNLCGSNFDSAPYMLKSREAQSYVCRKKDMDGLGSQPIHHSDKLRLSSSVAYMDVASGGPKSFQITNHLSPKNMSNGKQILRESSISSNLKESASAKLFTLLPDFDYHDECREKLPPSGISRNSKRKRDEQINFLSLRDESSGETETMDINACQTWNSLPSMGEHIAWFWKKSPFDYVKSQMHAVKCDRKYPFYNDSLDFVLKTWKAGGALKCYTEFPVYCVKIGHYVKVSSSSQENSFRLNIVPISPVQKLKGQFGNLYVIIAPPTTEQNDSFVRSYFKQVDVTIALLGIVCKRRDAISKLKVEREQLVERMDSFLRVVTSIPGIDKHNANAARSRSLPGDGTRDRVLSCLADLVIKLTAFRTATGIDVTPFTPDVPSKAASMCHPI
ncbi:hypothetical protein IFM89_003550 [Coptis chinensis]|uniref:Uncharacterized protein n=1 Tax=Coptis chinensis TaxID=261450 RepID=A0A835IY02_9MAGN|nr:hypothetical protein IFM89_003550 [Coptis chinensis]